MNGRIVACALLLASCGARSGLLDDTYDAPEDSGRDAGRPRDAGRMRDAGSRDGGTMACELVVSEPVEVFARDSGVFDQPLVAVRGERIDFVARHVQMGRAGTVVARSASIDGAEIAFDDLGGQILPPFATWIRAASVGSSLVVCTQVDMPMTHQLFYFDAAHRMTRAVALDSTACNDLAGNASRLLVAENMFNTFVSEWNEAGEIVAPREPAFDPGVGANMQATAMSRVSGFAWVGTLSVDLDTQVVMRDDAGERRVDFVRGPRRESGATPAIAEGPHDGSVAVAFYEEHSIVVVILNEMGEYSRSEPLVFSMDADVDPTIARLGREHLLVASLNYGDIPFSGVLDLSALNGYGRRAGNSTLFVERRDERHGGIDALSVAGGVVVHWSESIGDRAVTRAVFARCE